MATIAASGALAENPGKRKPAAVGAPVAAAEASPADANNPIVQLIRDPRVQKELTVRPGQSQALDLAYAKIEPRLWLLRDFGTGPGVEEKARLFAAMEGDADSILDPTQRTRLRQIVVRARGWSGISAEPTAGRLKLSAEQIKRIDEIAERTRLETQKVIASGDAPAAREQAIEKLRTSEGTSIQKLLSAEQRQTLAELVGDAYDLAQVQPLSFKAPEIAAVDTWLNSPPLKLSGLRGKVVAFHFWAFNCGNCINNLPHYTRWHDELASRGLVVVGMHTPETQAERNVDTLRSRLDQHAIRYPVAVDRDAANWAAWANSMWPSVYLIDKQGRVRYWWYGEMNWQGTEGEKFMRQRIEQLLAER